MPETLLWAHISAKSIVIKGALAHQMWLWTFRWSAYEGCVSDYDTTYHATTLDVVFWGTQLCGETEYRGFCSNSQILKINGSSNQCQSTTLYALKKSSLTNRTCWFYLCRAIFWWFPSEQATKARRWRYDGFLTNLVDLTLLFYTPSSHREAVCLCCCYSIVSFCKFGVEVADLPLHMSACKKPLLSAESVLQNSNFCQNLAKWGRGAQGKRTMPNLQGRGQSATIKIGNISLIKGMYRRVVFVRDCYSHIFRHIWSHLSSKKNGEHDLESQSQWLECQRFDWQDTFSDCNGDRAVWLLGAITSSAWPFH